MQGSSPNRLSPLPSGEQAAHDSALAMLHTGQGDPMACVDLLLKNHPGFLAGYCLRAALLVMASREDAQGELARTLQAARAVPAGLASERERRHLDAAASWLRRDMKHALQQYGDIVADHPHDTLALRVAHFGDLQWSRTIQLRDRVAAVLPFWHEGMPGFGHVLGMYAFGLAEAGDHVEAELIGRRALDFHPDNAGAIHAVAHALEMQGRAAEGIAWLHATSPRWERSGYAKHLWWHLALFHLDLGELPAALQIHDCRLRACATADGNADAPALVDASALLWRLQLRGVDVGARWQALADGWLDKSLGGLRPFNDTHAMLAFVGADRLASARRLMNALRAFAARSRDLDPVIREAALPVCEALMQFGAGRYAAAVASLVRYRHLTERCGGSKAQCDLLHLTLLEAALRSGQQELARALVAERLSQRPHSRFNRWLRVHVGRFSSMVAPLPGHLTSMPGKAPRPLLAA